MNNANISIRIFDKNPKNHPIACKSMLVRFALIADSVTFTSGKPNVIGIFDVIPAGNFPARHQQMDYIVNLEGTIAEKGEHQISIELRTSNGERILPPFEQKIQLQREDEAHQNIRAGIIMKLQNVIFQKPGKYEFVVFADNRFLCRTTFVVKHLTNPPAREA